MDLQKTQHYTTEQHKICGNLLSYIPEGARLVEPFVGKGDLLSLFPNKDWELYDIEPRLENAIQRDTLASPLDYTGKWVITNPPYLAKNKATNKEIFSQYSVDDLYKAALITFLSAEGGIVIIPSNFFTDERTGTIRKVFLDKFEILEINFFTTPVFQSTTYSVCSFAFRKKITPSEFQIIKANSYPDGTSCKVQLDRQYDYRVAGKFYKDLKSIKEIFTRLTTNVPQNKYLTNIKLYALDTRTDKIRLEYCEEPFYGKASDRSYATFVSDVFLSEENQKEIIEQFNKELNNFREQFGNLSLTNYRDYNRKRIGFTLAYQLASKIYLDIKNKQGG